MNLREFDSAEPLCKFGPGGDFTVPYPVIPAGEKCKWVTLIANTKGSQTQIIITLPFIMTSDEIHKLSKDLAEATKELSAKYLGPSTKEILIDL
jgi:hypothetical protein